MRIEELQMERMQSTWENLVDYDLSESGVRPLSLSDLVDLGFDLSAVMDMPLGYSQSNGTPELKERIAALYPGATPEHIEVTNGTSEANYLVALSQIRAGDEFALEMPNYMQLWGLPRSLNATVKAFELSFENNWEPDWEQFDRAVNPNTRLVYISHPNNPTGKVLSREATERIVARCDEVDALLISDEVYLGAEIDRSRTHSLWGTSERVVVTSGLSKAYGIPGIRVGWIVGPPNLVAECWSQHDYITIAPNKLSDVMARTAVRQDNREKLYARTQRILRENLPIFRQWTDSFDGFFEFRDPDAGAIAMVKYRADIKSIELCARIRENQSTLIVPGSHLGLEGFVRIWTGGEQEYLSEGLRRVETEVRKLL